MGLKFKSARLPEPWLLPFHSFGLNRALGGGLKSGRFHLLSGPKGSTKTTMALKLIGEAQRMGKRCAYIDAEHSFETSYAEKCDVDVDTLMFQDEGVNVAEELMGLILPPLKSKDLDLVVFDSMNMIQMESMISSAEDKSMAPDARSQKFILTKLINVIDRNMQLIFISHASYQKVGQNFMLKAAVGTKTEHVMSTMLNFTANDGASNFRDLDNAQKVTWKINKAKQDCWPLKGEYYFHKPSARIDTVAEIASIAQDLDIVSGAAWKQYKDRKFHGEQQLIAEMREEPAFLDEISRAILQVDKDTRHIFAGGVDYSGVDESA